jgi:hypothetical protein
MTPYEQGFIDKCAEYGIDPVKLAAVTTNQYGTVNWGAKDIPPIYHTDPTKRQQPLFDYANVKGKHPEGPITLGGRNSANISYGGKSYTPTNMFSVLNNFATNPNAVASSADMGLPKDVKLNFTSGANTNYYKPIDSTAPRWPAITVARQPGMMDSVTQNPAYKATTGLLERGIKGVGNTISSIPGGIKRIGQGISSGIGNTELGKNYKDTVDTFKSMKGTFGPDTPEVAKNRAGMEQLVGKGYSGSIGAAV